MAPIIKWTPKQRKDWDTWVASRPEAVRSTCKRFPPDRLYRLRTTGQRVTILSYSEDGTVTVSLSARYNLVIFERQVVGITPQDLEETELPPSGELVGALLTDRTDIETYINEWREAHGIGGARHRKPA